MVDLQSWFLIPTPLFFDAAAAVYAATVGVVAAANCFCRRGTDTETQAKADAETHLDTGVDDEGRAAPKSTVDVKAASSCFNELLFGFYCEISQFHKS